MLCDVMLNFCIISVCVNVDNNIIMIIINYLFLVRHVQKY